MSKPFESGDLVILVYATAKEAKLLVGQIHKLRCRCRAYPGAWQFEPELIVGGRPVSWDERDMRPIRDQPGNEQFVTDARKSLPSNGTRITERGEIA